MKIMKVSEITNGISALIQKKEQEKLDILDLKNAINEIINLDDALQSEGGKAIKEHFTTYHLKAVTLFNSFLEEYIQILKDIKDSVEVSEGATGLIRTDFLIEEVQSKLNELESVSNDIVASINKQYEEISDLVTDGRVSTYYLNLNISHAREHTENTAAKLEALDEENTARLETVENSVNDINQFIAKIESPLRNNVSSTNPQLNER